MKSRIARLKHLREISLRDLLTVILPAGLLLAGGFWLAAQFIKPAPPNYLYISSGAPGGSYEVYAERYRQVLARNGVELRDQPSAGSMENLKRLLDEEDDTEVALVQSGTANGVNVETLFSLGYLYYEPLWVFYRGGRELDRLTQLKGSRIAVGAEGSGTRKLALQLLEANGVDAKNATLLPLGGLTAVEALQGSKADAVFLVGSERSAAVWSLLYAEGVTWVSVWLLTFPLLVPLSLGHTAVATLVWSIAEWLVRGSPTMLGAASGAVAGLVAITPACGWVGPMGAIAIGLVAGFVCLWAVAGLKQKLGYDDSLDVFGVHCVGGIVGALLTAVFCSPALGGTGVYDYVANAVAEYSMGAQFKAQLIGVVVSLVWSGVVAAVAFKVVDLVVGLRVAEDQEREGLDTVSHGERAYN